MPTPRSVEPTDVSEKYYQGANAARHINEARLPVKTPPLDSLDIKWEQWGNPNAPDDKTIGEQAAKEDTTFGLREACHRSRARPRFAPSRQARPRCAAPRHASRPMPHLAKRYASHHSAAPCPPPRRYRVPTHHRINALSTPATVIFPSFSHGSHAKSSAENETPGWWEFIIGPGEYLDTNKVRCGLAGGQSSHIVEPLG